MSTSSKDRKVVKMQASNLEKRMSQFLASATEDPASNKKVLETVKLITPNTLNTARSSSATAKPAPSAPAEPAVAEDKMDVDTQAPEGHDAFATANFNTDFDPSLAIYDEDDFAIAPPPTTTPVAPEKKAGGEAPPKKPVAPAPVITPTPKPAEDPKKATKPAQTAESVPVSKPDSKKPASEPSAAPTSSQDKKPAQPKKEVENNKKKKAAKFIDDQAEADDDGEDDEEGLPTAEDLAFIKNDDEEDSEDGEVSDEVDTKQEKSKKKKKALSPAQLLAQERMKEDEKFHKLAERAEKIFGSEDIDGSSTIPELLHATGAKKSALRKKYMDMDDDEGQDDDPEADDMIVEKEKRNMLGDEDADLSAEEAAELAAAEANGDGEEEEEEKGDDDEEEEDDAQISRLNASISSDAEKEEDDEEGEAKEDNDNNSDDEKPEKVTSSASPKKKGASTQEPELKGKQKLLAQQKNREAELNSFIEAGNAAVLNTEGRQEMIGNIRTINEIKVCDGDDDDEDEDEDTDTKPPSKSQPSPPPPTTDNNKGKKTPPNSKGASTTASSSSAAIEKLKTPANIDHHTLVDIQIPHIKNILVAAKDRTSQVDAKVIKIVTAAVLKSITSGLVSNASSNKFTVEDQEAIGKMLDLFINKMDSLYAAFTTSHLLDDISKAAESRVVRELAKIFILSRTYPMTLVTMIPAARELTCCLTGKTIKLGENYHQLIFAIENVQFKGEGEKKIHTFTMPIGATISFAGESAPTTKKKPNFVIGKSATAESVAEPKPKPAPAEKEVDAMDIDHPVVSNAPNKQPQLPVADGNDDDEENAPIFGDDGEAGDAMDVVVPETLGEKINQGYYGIVIKDAAGFLHLLKYVSKLRNNPSTINTLATKGAGGKTIGNFTAEGYPKLVVDWVAFATLTFFKHLFDIVHDRRTIEVALRDEYTEISPRDGLYFYVPHGTSMESDDFSSLTVFLKSFNVFVFSKLKEDLDAIEEKLANDPDMKKRINPEMTSPLVLMMTKKILPDDDLLKSHFGFAGQGQKLLEPFRYNMARHDYCARLVTLLTTPEPMVSTV